MMMETSFREPNLNPPEPRVAHQCSWCDEPIYEGEDCYDMRPYGWCCKYCLEDRLTVAGEYDG